MGLSTGLYLANRNQRAAQLPFGTSIANASFAERNMLRGSREEMSEETEFDLRMLYRLAKAVASFGTGEGLAIAADLGVCYWCATPEPCSKDHSAETQKLLDDNLDRVLAVFGLEFNC